MKKMFNRNITSNLVKVLSRRYIWKLASAVLAGILIGLISSIIWSASARADDFFKCFDANECTQALSSSIDCLNPRDYQITTPNIGSSDVTVLSFHGGKIEPKTSEISKNLAKRYGWNRYDLYGNGTDACLNGKDNFQKLHITATKFDDPNALKLVKAHHKSVAIHGYRRDYRGIICVGGGNHTQVTTFIDYVNEHKSAFQSSSGGYQLIPVNATLSENQEAVCSGLKGTDPDNIVNKNGSGQGGLQLELSPGMRKDLAKLSEVKFNSLRDVIYDAVAQAMAD